MGGMNGLPAKPAGVAGRMLSGQNGHKDLLDVIPRLDTFPRNVGPTHDVGGAGVDGAWQERGRIPGMTNTLTATLRTNRGPVVVRLYPDHAPKTVRNFVELAEGTREWTNPVTRKASNDPLYNGTVFHRVIPDFMIQGGDPLGTGTGGPGYRFADEFHPDLAFDRPYLLAMANAGPGTNGSQFFITTVPTPWLTGKHTIFGEVIDGSNVVEEISRVQTSRGDRPVSDVVLESVEIGRGEDRDRKSVV